MRDLVAAVRALSSNRILLIGWLGFLIYAFPGYMSFDSVAQLQMARSGYITDGHPPFMAALWRVVELFVAGPVGMLLLQSAAFLVGGYLIFRRFMAPRRAAIAAGLVLWLPPIAAVMAVIWKDAMMTGFLVLGLGLAIQDPEPTGALRMHRIPALLAFLAATLMRHNALVMTGPLVLFCFVWNPRHGFIKRHAIAIAAWIGITFAAQLISGWLTDKKLHLWHTSLALCDMTGTMRYTADSMTDQWLARELPGVRFKVSEVQSFVQRADLHGDYIGNLWKTTYTVFDAPTTAQDRAAITKAWRTVVFDHLDGYLTHRWEIVRRLLEIDDVPKASPIYNWFSDIQDPFGSAAKMNHHAAAARIQDVMRTQMHVMGVTPIFTVVVYVVLSAILMPFAFADRRVLGLLASGIASEAALLVISPTPDWRYSFWLIVAVVISAMAVVARRTRRSRLQRRLQR